MRTIGETIRHLRTTARMTQEQLGSQVGLDTPAVSRIESGAREVKAAELAAIARVLGVSPMAILEPDSFLGRLVMLPRSTAGSVGDAARRRLIQLAEFHELLDEEGVPTGGLDVAGMPMIAVTEPWLQSSATLARWARARCPDMPADGDGHVDVLAEAIESCFGIDVLIEKYDERAFLGAAITAPDFPLILVNAMQRPQRALFTLAHELGHVITAAALGEAEETNAHLDGGTLAPHGDTTEKRANAFAAAFLMPEEEIRAAVGRGLAPDLLAELLLRFGVSWQSLIYRLGDLRLIDAVTRTKLHAVGFTSLQQAISNSDLRERLAHVNRRTAAPAHRPLRLVERTQRGYETGVLSIRPYAALQGISVDEALRELAPAKEWDSSLSPGPAPPGHACGDIYEMSPV